MADRGWKVVNLGEAEGLEHAQSGLGYLFGEDRPYESDRHFGMNVRVLQPGQPASLYHSEPNEEIFFVLGGECLAIVDDEEVRLRRWDYLQTPANTPHVIVGAGDGPSWVLMVGERRGDGPPRYPVSEVAARYGASVREEVEGGAEGYEQVGWERRFEPAPLPWPPK